MEDGADEELVCDENGLLVLTPGGTREGLEYVEAHSGSVGYFINMLGEGEHWVESDTQDFRVSLEWEGLSLPHDPRVHAGLVWTVVNIVTY